MTVTQYLGTGAVSRGRMIIRPQGLSTFVSLAPYLHNDFDKEAVIKGIDNIREIFNKVANLTWVTPPTNQTTADFVNSVSAQKNCDTVTCVNQAIDSRYRRQAPRQPLARLRTHRYRQWSQGWQLCG